MSKKLIVWHHLGMGDHLVMNAFVHILLEMMKPDELLLVTKEQNMKTVELMYKGHPQVKLHSIRNHIYGDISDIIANLQTLLNTGYKFIGSGVHGPKAKDYMSLDPCWANCFYKEYGLPPQLRWKMFRFPDQSVFETSKKLGEHVLKTIGHPYIVIHDDPSRNFKITPEKVHQLVSADGMKDVPVLYLGKRRYEYPLFEGLKNVSLPELTTTETLYDYCHILANAAACHMMDSSIAILLDYLDTRPEQKRYMHQYAKAHEMLPTEGLFQKEWKILT